MFLTCKLRASRRGPGVLLAATGASLLISGAMMASGDSGPMNAQAKRGAVLFQKNCIACHNKQAGDMTPFGPPNLHGVLRRKVLTTAEAGAIIRRGKGAMPPFGAKLSAAQVADLIAWLRTQ